jgi:hypothetical protein
MHASSSSNQFLRLHNELWDKRGALAEDNVNFSPQFSPEPLLHEKWAFFVRATDAGRLKFSSFHDHVGHDIAVLRGAAVSPEFWNFVRQHGNFTESGSGEANFRMLEAGRVDYAVLAFDQGVRLTIGNEAAARTPVDGNTLLINAGGNLLISPHVRKVNYDPLTSFEPILRAR